MPDDVDRLVTRTIKALGGVTDPDALEAMRHRVLGRRGEIAALLKGLPALSGPERASRGARLNSARETLLLAFDARAAELATTRETERLAAERIDVSLPGRRGPLGRRHVLRRTLDEVERIFVGLGFEVVEGTEVETDEFNFGRLNMPRDHPARDTQDTFYLGDELLLRTHATVVDARVMAGRTPPLRIVTSGRCYRRDPVDATHMPVFHQVDGFMVGENITFANVKGVLATFAREMFGPQTRTRFQPSYFPFTEPSAEVDVQWRGRWLEVMGCGMVDPAVLEGLGLDPERWSGFAAGLGVERFCMVRHGIDDIRRLYTSDLRFLEQF